MKNAKTRISLLIAVLLASGCTHTKTPSKSSDVQVPSNDNRDFRADGIAAASGADSMLRAADLQADVAILRRAYETLHPGLLRYNTPAQFDAAVGTLGLEFRQDRTLAQAYLAFSVFAATVKCGHTYPNFFNQSESVTAALFQAPRLPFYFCWLGDRMIVTRSFTTDERIRAGVEIVAINDVSVAAILERLMTVARADGNNDSKRVAYLQVEGTSRYEAFDIYWPLFFPSSAPVVTLRVRGPEGNREQVVSVPPVTYEDRLAVVEAAGGASVDKNAPIWSFRLLDDRTGYLRMPSWVLYNSKWNWKASLDETFETLVTSGATDLVIDLRGNEGGSDVGDVIVSHLITAPVPRQAVNRLVRYRKVPDDLAPYLETWDPSFKDWGSAAIDSTDRFYRLRRDADDDLGGVITPSLPRFTGRLWVLVGATNSSATFEFAQTIRQNKLGTLVGQPTGGNQRGINGGAFFFLRLPHSGIELDLPLIGQFPDGERPDAGLQPDIFVAPTVKDIASGRDAELDAVQALMHRDGLKKREA
ncbi:MAG: S41 family peptidase [Planctomycetota bacterium]